jgi:membrane protease YdiL (CAAX protease family)
MDANLATTKDLFARKRAVKTLVTFLVLTTVLSGAVYALAWWRGGIGQYAALLMLMPGVAGLASAHIFYGRRTGIGWRPGRPRFLILGAGIPIAYSAALYGFLILTGGVGTKSGVGSWLVSPSGFTALVISSAVPAVLSAAGEEVGWRGVLVPNLGRLYGYTTVALVSSAIWAVWHYPLWFLGLEHSPIPLVVALIFFTCLTLGLGSVQAWLRLRSGSVWPPILLHASHNLFVLAVVQRSIVAPGHGTDWLAGETGAGLAVVGLLLLVLMLLLQSRNRQHAVTPAAVRAVA